MARKKQHPPAPPVEPETPKDIETYERQVTRAIGISQTLEPLQLSHWISKRQTKPPIVHGSIVSVTVIPQDVEVDVSTIAWKLTFSAKTVEETLMTSEVVRGNRLTNMGLKLNYYSLVLKDGHKVYKLNHNEIQEKSQKLMSSLIEYVIGGNPTFKDMLKFVYGVWNFIDTPRCFFIYSDGYFLLKFTSEEDKIELLQNELCNFNSRPLVLQQWIPNFQLSKEPMQVIPIWLTFLGLPIQFWVAKNIGRIGSSLGKTICNRLTAHGEQISYVRMLIDMDITQVLPKLIYIEIA